MSEYSLVYTSFERAGKFPLEADYVFDNEDALREHFLSDPLKAATLHEGLLKIVKDDGDGNQALYWVVPDESGKLDFRKLLTAGSADELSELTESLADLTEQLGTLKTAVTALGEATLSGEDSLKNQIKAIVGCDDGDNVLEFLAELPYGSLKEISEWIENVDTEAVWNRIEGDPLPSSGFQTLRGVEDFVSKAAADNAYAHKNMIGEIDKIETAVGLNADGSFSPDPTTNYLTGATSVQHALRILDSLVTTLGKGGIQDGWYDKESESLVLEILVDNESGESETKLISIPVGDLIEEWDVSDSDESCVKLTKTRVEGGGPDLLSAGIEWEEYGEDEGEGGDDGDGDDDDDDDDNN